MSIMDPVAPLYAPYAWEHAPLRSSASIAKVLTNYAGYWTACAYEDPAGVLIKSRDTILVIPVKLK